MFSNSGAATWYAVWGDGMKASVEGWDDNNLTDGDGWSSNWVVEQGYICKESPSTSPSICNTIWGDGKRAGMFNKSPLYFLNKYEQNRHRNMRRW